MRAFLSSLHRDTRGAISVAANNTGSAANLVFDTSTGTNASSVSLNGAITTVAVGSNQSGLRILTKGAPISTTAGISLTGLIDFNNTVSLVGGVATAMPGTAATGGNYGFQAITSPINVSGEIDIRGQGAAATYYGIESDSTISSSAGNISLIGKGDGGVSFGAAVTAGSGALVRNLSVIGTGTAGATRRLFEVVGAQVPPAELAGHFHDTYGQALANIYACLELGIHTFDTSVAGLGGCPYAKGATGNVATEDVVYMLHGMGIETGIDLDQLIDAGAYISGFLDRKPNSRAANALLTRRAG